MRKKYFLSHSTVTNLHRHFVCMWDDRIRRGTAITSLNHSSGDARLIIAYKKRDYKKNIFLWCMKLHSWLRERDTHLELDAKNFRDKKRFGMSCFSLCRTTGKNMCAKNHTRTLMAPGTIVETAKKKNLCIFKKNKNKIFIVEHYLIYELFEAFMQQKTTRLTLIALVLSLTCEWNSHHRKIDFLWRIIMYPNTNVTCTLIFLSWLRHNKPQQLHRNHDHVRGMKIVMIMNKTYHLQFTYDTVNDLDGGFNF